MKNTFKTKVMAVVIAAVCVTGVASAVSIANAYANVGTSASSTSGGKVIVEKTDGKSFILPIRGEDWNYYADSLNVKIGCDYDYADSLCKFRLTAQKEGVTNAVLKTQNVDGTWTNTPVCITVAKDLTMHIEQSGSAYITGTASTSQTSSSDTGAGTDTKPETQPETKPDTKPAVTAGETYKISIAGCDWTYFISTLNVKVSCDFDYNSNICNFSITALKAGVTDVVLKTQLENGKWLNTPIRITADNDLRITASQTAEAYVTEKSSTV